MRLTDWHPRPCPLSPRACSRAWVAAPALLVPMALLLSLEAAQAQGVPVVDGKSVVQQALEIAEMSALSGARELEAEKKGQMAGLHQEQLEALDATLAMMTGAAPFLGDLDMLPGAEADVLYAVEDNNPYAARLFGEASNTTDAGLHYGMHASAEIEASLRRLRAIVEKIPMTTSTKEALDLNTYARAEAVRLSLMVERVKAARVKVEQARYALWLQA